MDDYIRKYNMKLCDTDESLINVYSDTECEYSAGLINKQNMWSSLYDLYR